SRLERQLTPGVTRGHGWESTGTAIDSRRHSRSRMEALLRKVGGIRAKNPAAWQQPAFCCHAATILARMPLCKQSGWRPPLLAPWPRHHGFGRAWQSADCRRIVAAACHILPNQGGSCMKTRILGRTGLAVSELAMGGLF